MEFVHNNMWVILVILAAFFNALWSSLTKNKDESISAFDFTVLFRLYTVFMIAPFALYYIKWSYFKEPMFIMMAIGYAVAEGLRTIFMVKGAEEDYYATYAFVNMSPVIPLLFAPFISDEKLTVFIIAGTLVTILGGFVFYRMGKFSKWGMAIAIIGGIGIIISKEGVKCSDGISFPFVSFIFSVLIFSGAKYFKTGHNVLAGTVKNLKNKRIMMPSFFSTIATMTYFTSLNMAPMTKVAPLMRFNLLFGFLLSYFMLKEITDWKSKLFGGCLIIAGGVMVYAG